jgi:hypothetical protein
MATTGTERSLGESDIHDVLRNDRRRLALDCLQGVDSCSMSLRELSEAVASLETGEEPAPRDKRQSVYVSLHQTHLPKLDDLGIVDYDSTSKAVRLTERMAEVEVYMQVVPQYGLSWGEYYLALAMLGLLATVGVLVGVPGLSSLGAGLVSTAFFLAFGASAVYHVRSQQEGLPFGRLL